MRRAGVVAVMGLTLALAGGLAQHHEGHPEQAAEGSGQGHSGGPSGGHSGGSLEWWKWANFALLAGALGWAIRKNAGPFFDGRSREIRRQLVEAGEIRAEADRRTREVEARLANLGTEIEALRREALAEQEAETERFRVRAAAEMAKIQAQAEREIGAAGKQARLDLKRYAAALALETAAGRIRARMTPAAGQALVDSFVRELGEPSRHGLFR